MSKNTLFRGGEDLGGGLEEHFFICWILKIISRLFHTDYGEASVFSKSKICTNTSSLLADGLSQFLSPAVSIIL